MDLPEVTWKSDVFQAAAYNRYASITNVGHPGRLPIGPYAEVPHLPRVHILGSARAQGPLLQQEQVPYSHLGFFWDSGCRL